MPVANVILKHRAGEQDEFFKCFEGAVLPSVDRSSSAGRFSSVGTIEGTSFG